MGLLCIALQGQPELLSALQYPGCKVAQYAPWASEITCKNDNARSAEHTSFIELINEVAHVGDLQLEMVRQVKKLVDTEGIATLLCTATQG